MTSKPFNPPSQEGSEQNLSPRQSTSGPRSESPSPGKGELSEVPITTLASESPVLAGPGAEQGLPSGGPPTQASDGDQEVVVSETNRRVKVYRLEDNAWQDKGTGFVEGIYESSLDEAILVVVREDAEENPAATADKTGAETEAPGGFLRASDPDPDAQYLLKSKVSKTGFYSRQQETLIVWTEPSGIEVALSFQDPEGCNNIASFIDDIQQHLQMAYEEHAQMSSSSPAPMSPPVTHDPVNTGYAEREAPGWPTLSLVNLKDQAESLKMSTQSIAGREKTVEFVVSNDYVRQMISTFGDAEDLESVTDLHILCGMMTTILTLNDNALYEYLLREDVFIGVAGMMEYDPEYPDYKASYREFLAETTRFKEVVKIEDQAILAKIHQTYRLLYLKDVILARVLDDPTFNILNSLLFFNQIDIIAYVSNTESFLKGVFEGFRETKLKDSMAKAGTTEPAEQDQAEMDRKRNVVALLHQLMLMGKQVQQQHRQQLYRTLMEHGLLFVCEWALSSTNPQLLNQASEMLAIVLEHDINAVRQHSLKENEAKRRTIAEEICDLLIRSEDLGLKSQMADAIRTLLDIGLEATDPPALRAQKHGAAAESFLAYYYEVLAVPMYKPLLNLPDYRVKRDTSIKLPITSAPDAMLLQYLAEIAAMLVTQHGHRAQYFVLSNPISARVAGLAGMKQKALKHASIRFFKACVKSNNHFLHRHIMKHDLLAPMIDLLSPDAPRDNMLSSACLEVLEIVRKENLKPLVNHIFERHRPKLQELSQRPHLRAFIIALVLRWEQNNEPPPASPEPAAETDENGRSAATQNREEDYFNGSDNEEPAQPTTPRPARNSPANKRKREPEADAESSRSGKKAHVAVSPSRSSLGLDYSDSEDSDPEQSPESRGRVATPKLSLKTEPGDLKIPARQAEDEGNSGMLLSGGRPATPVATRADVKDRIVGTVKDAGRKLRINIQGFGKKGSDASGSN